MATTGGEDQQPASERPKRQPESYTWPLVAIVVAILPQILVPSRYRVGPPAIVPIIEIVAFLVMLGIAAKPGPVPRQARPTILILFGLLIAANTAAAARLVWLVLDGGQVDSTPLTAARLLVAGVMVLIANVITFGLLYWQLDGGGPAGRVSEDPPYPDFLFPQTVSPQLSAPGWRPSFPDHLYVAFTNVVAFSPTDADPLTPRAKGLMGLQAMISLGVLVVVLARVINILPS
ncbi:uncharacterized membrane protein [Jatrophihabitans sp. GAS493]|uniref:hypothetical protein n=1 Tax=Jatrophihabitans sp. GAS493 TaxID=1907575 RepID=UPI000BB71068|nr:hypothetical protein [Jatrophihabitans sp. GAS493]SOD74560.1 uncharacterized membrane protein [Jatrophihabitans sp. GAS493]